MDTPRRQLAIWIGYLPAVLALALIVLLAVVQGRWSDRWSKPGADIKDLAALLEGVPMTVDEWEGEDQPADSGELQASGAVGHVTRVYRNRATGERVSLFIICGHSRNISVHTPDRCYPAAGFEPLDSPIKHMIHAGGSDAEFYTATYRKQDPVGTQQVRVFWSWCQDDRWEAPNYPRSTFRGLRALFKLYLISAVGRGQVPLDESPCIKLGEVLLPEVDRAVLSPRLREPANADTATN